MLEANKFIKIAAVGNFFLNEGISIYNTLYFNELKKYYNNIDYLISKEEKVNKDIKNVFQIWSKYNDNFDFLINHIINNDYKVVHIQYHSDNTFSYDNLDKIIIKLSKNKIKIIVTLHSFFLKSFNLYQKIKNLNLVDKIIVHSKEEKSFLNKEDLNVFYLPHFRMTYNLYSKEEIKRKTNVASYDPIIVTHGLLNINKNVIKVVKALELLKRDFKNPLLVCINAVSDGNILSFAIEKEIKQYIEQKNLEKNVLFITGFLDSEEVNVVMQLADFHVMAYSESGESASGAINRSMGVGVPTIVSSVGAFKEFKGEVYKISDISAPSIYKAVKKLKKDSKIVSLMLKKSSEFVSEHSLQNLIKKTLEFYIPN